MTEILIGIATTVILGLIGVVWAMLNSRLKRMEETKVDRAWCVPTHKAITDDLSELKLGQKELIGKIGKIEVYLAGLNGDMIRRREGAIKTRADDKEVAGQEKKT